MIKFTFHIAHLFFYIYVLTEAWRKEDETRMLKPITLSIYEETQHLILMKLMHSYPLKQSHTKHGRVFKYDHEDYPN